MSLGDRVIVLIDTGAGKVREETVEARSAGGNVVGVVGQFTARAEERTRNGRVIRSVDVPVARLIALIEVPRGR